jgi:hypothetical protein
MTSRESAFETQLESGFATPKSQGAFDTLGGEGSAEQKRIRKGRLPYAMTRFSFGTERDYFGWLPAEITRAVPESLINTIASVVCHAHRMGREEAHNFLKQFVLEQIRVPDWPHHPMKDLRNMNPPPLLPPQDA